ncbi:MAG: hypothetical protein CFH39_00041, partial [Alphaproteobacteria bacterium MarineAlpha10_Bin2]
GKCEKGRSSLGQKADIPKDDFGIICEIHLYNRALSADEVKELYLFTSAFPSAE